MLVLYAPAVVMKRSLSHSLLMTGYPQHNNKGRERRKLKGQINREKIRLVLVALSQIESLIKQQTDYSSSSYMKNQNKRTKPTGFNWMCSSLLFQAGCPAARDSTTTNDNPKGCGA